MAKAKSESGVEARSGNYQTNPLYDRANQITGWRIRAELTLESRDFKAAGALASRLQPAMKLSAMAFSLSRAAREKAEAGAADRSPRPSIRRRRRSSPGRSAFRATRWAR